ncbi:hypothetical protein [Sphingopyxis sp.]|jgi:hypothetical protein|uniref:hypothetical protein n=1 Tax=Sphingopyxis sp. TaxID=1908224 RepID=UPI002DEAECB2|nr:hypothetical protein [Sphingopyxis sp.]
MTVRDLRWRIAGATLLIMGYFVVDAATKAAGGADMFGLLGLLVAAGGLLLLIGGKRVALALKVERSRHRELPGAIRVARQARQRDL